MSTDDEGIYRVDTVPPPQGEADAYNAPTRVGPMASAIVEEMLVAGRREAAAAETKAKPVDPAAMLDSDALVAKLEAAAAAPAPIEAGSSEKKTVPPPAPAPAAEPPPASVEPAVLSTKAAGAEQKTSGEIAGRSNTTLLLAVVVVLALVGIYLLRR